MKFFTNAICCCLQAPRPSVLTIVLRLPFLEMPCRGEGSCCNFSPTPGRSLPRCFLACEQPFNGFAEFAANSQQNLGPDFSFAVLHIREVSLAHADMIANCC